MVKETRGAERRFRATGGLSFRRVTWRCFFKSHDANLEGRARSRAGGSELKRKASFQSSQQLLSIFLIQVMVLEI